MLIIGSEPRSTAEKVRASALLPFRAWLSNELIETWCREAQHVWRARVYDPVVTLSACIHKQLVAGRSARHVEDWVDGLSDGPGGGDGNDFCRARERLPESVFEHAVAHTGAQAHATVASWRGLRVVLVDGTTMRAPRTAANIKEFGQSNSCKGKSILPIVRIVLAVCAFTGAVLKQRIGRYVEGELRMLYEMLEDVAPGTLLIGDGAYNSYLFFSRVRAAGGQALAPLDPTRRSTCVRRFSKHDELHEWTRPPVAVSAFPEELAQAPKSQKVRVITHTLHRKDYQPYELRLCTTLLDPKKYPAAELIEHYLRRWGIEVHLRSLKEGLSLARLSTKTPATVRKEILSGILAFNMVRLSAAKSKGPAERISFERARELLTEFSARMSTAPTARLPELQRQLLELIAQAINQPQVRPPEPRAILKHRSCYPLLRTSRTAWRRRHARA